MKNFIFSALISLSVFSYRYGCVEHIISFLAIAIATANDATKLQAEQSKYFFIFRLWLCYGSVQSESGSESKTKYYGVA